MDLFEHGLKDMYFVEQHLVKTLGEQAEESRTDSIKEAFLGHQKQTQTQLERLETAFSVLGMKPDTVTCEGILGLMREKEDFSKEKPSSELMELFNVETGKKVEHYEISSYESLVQQANALGLTEIRDILEENLSEERETLSKLEQLEENATQMLKA